MWKLLSTKVDVRNANYVRKSYVVIRRYYIISILIVHQIKFIVVFDKNVTTARITKRIYFMIKVLKYNRFIQRISYRADFANMHAT